jgi:uncharacterized protein
MSLVVTDTSPVRALLHLNLLQLLGNLYAEVLIPPAVYGELVAPGSGLRPIPRESIAFLHVQSPRDQQRITELRRRLDSGESEAIALALEVGADALLIDESEGRRVARELGIATTGALGVLLQAKQRALVLQIAPLLDQLQNELQFFVSAELRARVLREAGE